MPLTTKKNQRIDNKVPRIPCQNNSGSLTVPPFGLVYISGTNGQGVPLVDRPSFYGADRPNGIMPGVDIFANGPAPIGPSGYGVVSNAWPLFVGYNSPPYLGEPLVVTKDSYFLNTLAGLHAGADFIACSNPAQGRVLVVPLIPPSAQLVEVSSLTLSTVPYFGGSASVRAYPAATVLLYGNAPIGSSQWIADEVAWLVPANGGFFALGVNYPAVFMGRDTSGVKIWTAGGDMTCIGPVVTGVTYVGGVLTVTNQYLNVPIGSSLVNSCGSSG